jgi:hypothetical protein
MPKEGSSDVLMSVSMAILTLGIHAAVSCFFSVLNCIGFVYGIIQQSLQRKVSIDFSKQVVVITGCDSGFGEMSSRRLSKMGFKVISGCISPDGAERLKDVVSSF